MPDEHVNLSALFDNCTVLCNTCGGEMRYHGEWPTHHPKSNKFENVSQAVRWACPTCRIKRQDGIQSGYPVMVVLIPSDYLIALLKK